ncbi:MAG: L,D-transpeptidase family protein [Hyphomicrobium sp.]
MTATRSLLLSALTAAALVAGCSSAPVIPPPSEVPLAKETLNLLGRKGMQAGSPVFVRIFKEESELEIWKQRDDGRFYHFKTYPICNWSGDLGPKQVQGDRQAPEGFYHITPTLMNPNSKFYLSFNLGYPNAYDKAQGRTGDSLMVHGKCRSAGCYAMTDAMMEEIYGLTRESLKAGQQSFQVQALPFRMTDARMAEMKKHRWYGFWRTLKQGYDHFEQHRIPPQVAVCEGRYVVNVNWQGRLEGNSPCPMFQRPVIAPFTPLPTDETITIADGNKLKGVISADVEPTAADVLAAKSAAGAVPSAVPSGATTTGATGTSSPNAASTPAASTLVKAE